MYFKAIALCSTEALTKSSNGSSLIIPHWYVSALLWSGSYLSDYEASKSRLGCNSREALWERSCLSSASRGTHLVLCWEGDSRILQDWCRKWSRWRWGSVLHEQSLCCHESQNRGLSITQSCCCHLQLRGALVQPSLAYYDVSSPLYGSIDKTYCTVYQMQLYSAIIKMRETFTFWIVLFLWCGLLDY